MGNSPSKGGGGCFCRHQDSRGQSDVRLPGSRLRFSKEQLQRLNLLLTRLEQQVDGEFREAFCCHVRDGMRLWHCISAVCNWSNVRLLNDRWVDVYCRWSDN